MRSEYVSSGRMTVMAKEPAARNKLRTDPRKATTAFLTREGIEIYSGDKREETLGNHALLTMRRLGIPYWEIYAISRAARSHPRNTIVLMRRNRQGLLAYISPFRWEWYILQDRNENARRE